MSLRTASPTLEEEAEAAGAEQSMSLNSPSQLPPTKLSTARNNVNYKEAFVTSTDHFLGLTLGLTFLLSSLFVFSRCKFPVLFLKVEIKVVDVASCWQIVGSQQSCLLICIITLGKVFLIKILGSPKMMIK